MSSRTMSESSRGEFTDSHVKVLQILSENHVSYKAEWVLDAYDFDGSGRPVSYKVDVLIQDVRFGFGVIEVDGSSHRTHGRALKDERKDERLKKLGLWVCRIPNNEASRVMEYLAVAGKAQEGKLL